MNMLGELRNLTPEQKLTASQIFDAIFEASESINDSDRENGDALEIAVRLLAAHQNSQTPEDSGHVIEFLAEECGLYQYIDRDNFSLLTQSVIEAHSVNLDKKLYLHSKQMQALLWLLEGDNVILSAPTSFGKSLLVDAFLSIRRPKIVVMILPTIALIDETRRRLIKALDETYHIVTSASTPFNKDKNTIFVLTQERFLAREDISEIDFLFVDEFYKLDPNRDDSRFETLNIALFGALKITKQSFMAGPHIKKIELGDRWTGKFRFMQTDYKTVTVNVIDRTKSENKLECFLTDLASVGNEASLVFTASPRSAHALLNNIVEAGIAYETKIGTKLGRWIAENYHPAWGLAGSTQRGIVVHHGRLPRALGQLFIHLFDKGEIKSLICTSTLIEGVNTSAANVFVFDKKINRTNFDFFSFANIRGRVGRMMQHYIGNAYLYHEPPAEIETNVDIPVLSDPGSATDYIVMNVDYSALSKQGQNRQLDLPGETGLDSQILKKHGGLGIDVLAQLNKEILAKAQSNLDSFVWSGMPDNLQRRFLAELVILVAKNRGEKFGRLTYKQVSWAWSQLRYYKHISEFLTWFTGRFGRDDEEDAIDRAFHFLQACEFNFPRIVKAIEALIKNKFPDLKIDYSPFIASLENWFRPNWIKQLDEIGLPLPLAERVSHLIDSKETIEDTVANIKRLLHTHPKHLDTVDKYIIRNLV